MDSRTLPVRAHSGSDLVTAMILELKVAAVFLVVLALLMVYVVCEFLWHQRRK